MVVTCSERRKVQALPEDFAHLVVNPAGKIITANQFLAELAGVVTGRRLSLRDLTGKTVQDVFGAKTGSTFVGHFLKHKEPVAGRYMIGNRLFQVVVGRRFEEGETFYEIFYFPVKTPDDETKQTVLQELVYEIALHKGYSHVDWTRQLSDEHCKQLISCLISHEHSTNPTEYCPYQHRCAFHPVHGSMQLDRRAFYRVPVDLAGEAYLRALKNRPLPLPLAKKKILCEALDLSLGGMKCKLKKIHLPEGSEVKLVFEEFEAEGSVVWSERDGEDSVIGVKFLGLDEEQQNRIIRAINKRRL